MAPSQILLTILALPLLLFLPGFLLAVAFLRPSTRAEKIALAPALSLASSALVLLVIEKTAEKFTAENVTIAVLILNSACAFFAWIRRHE